MPTIKEIIAKREELKATNPNATNVDARKSLMQAPQKGNAPVAGQAPAPMPTEPTPVNVNEQQRIDNQTKRQDMIAQGQVPAVGQNPTTGTGVDGVTVDANGNISNTTGKRQKIKNMSGQEFYVDADQAQMQQSFGTPGYGQGTTTPSGATLNANGTISQGSSTKTALEQSIEDAKNGVIRQPEYYNNLTNGTNSPVNEEIKAKNEAQMALNKQQAELRTQERQQIAKEQPVPSQDQIFTSLKQGVPVGDPKSLDFRQAQARVNTFKKFSTYDTASLATSLSSGDLLVGTKAYNDLVSDPNMAIKIQKAMAFNKGEVDLVKTGETQMANLLAQNPTVATALSDGYMSKEEYDQLTNNDEVSAQGKLVEEKKTKYETIKAQYDAVEDDVNTEFDGKEVTDSFKAKIVADRRKGMYKDYQIASLEYQNSLGTYTNLKADATALLAQNMELYKEQKAQEAEIAKEQRAIDNSLALSQMQFDQKIAQQTQMMNDPTTAISTMIEEYKKLGIPFTRSTQQIIQDFESSGQDLGTYLTELQKLVQEKPEYQAMQARKAGEGVSYQTFGDSVYRVNADGSLTKTDIDPKSTPVATQDWSKLDDTTLFNQRTGELKKVSPAEASAYGPSSADVSPEAIKAISNRLSGDNVQCGMVSNDWMAQKFPGAKRMGDSYESKVASVESIGVSDVPQVGGVFAMNTYNSNGHTGIVQSVDLANGTFTATDANKAGKASGGPVTTSTYKISDNFTFSKGPSGVGQARPADIEYFNSATATDKKKLQSNPQYQSFQESKNTVMVDPNADIYDVMKYSQGGKDMGEERLKSLGKFSQGLSQVAELSKKIQETETGPIIGRLRSYNPYDANAQALIAEINSVVPNIARGVYGEVGVLTDADIQNYAKTLPNIKSTEDTNKLVLAMTLKTMLNGFKGQIQIDGSAGRDVSGFAGTVKQYEDRINQLLSQIGGNTTSTTPQNTDPDFDALYNSL